MTLRVGLGIGKLSTCRWGFYAVAVALCYASTASALKVVNEQKLVPVTGSSDEVGWAVGLYGGTAVLGAPQDSTLGSSAGALHVRSLAGGEFLTLTASDGVAGDELGVSVDIDGDRIVAGAYHRWTAVGEPGRAYVFARNGAGWTEEAKLVAADGVPKDAFGWSIALDGDFLAVGAPRAWSGSPSGGGAVYVYERIDGEWIYVEKLTRGSDHSFGWSLDLDGNTLVVGSSLLANERVSVYVRDTLGWNLQATIDPDDSPGSEFGNAVALDGDDLVVGAWSDTENGNYGAAYFYRRQGTSWTQVQKVGSPGGERAEVFGEAVAIDGDLAVITDSGLDLDDEFEDVGAAYLYRRSGNGWSEAGRITPGDYATSTDYFGEAAAVQGSRILIGASLAFDEVSESTPGAGYSYQIAGGSKLMVKNAAPDNEFKNRIIFRGKGLVADVPLPGSPADPTCTGGATASIEVTSPTSGESFTQMLPCANWEQTAGGYRYRDPELDDGPCGKVSFEPASAIKALCKGSGPSVLDFDLEPSVVQAPINVRLTLGTASYCTEFGGTIKADGTNGALFKAVSGAATEACGGP